MTLALICAGLLAAPGGPPAPPPEVARAYQEARAKAGRSPEDQVRLALWCEARGLSSERLNHLALAVLADPANATARGLMGLVAYRGRFLRPEAVAERSGADPALAEYDARRQKAPYTAEGQWALGLWCDEHGLAEQAQAHFTAVTRLDPSRENAWRRLGYRKHDGQWTTDAQLAARKADAEAQKQADRRWRPLLERQRAMLGQPSRREEAEAALAGVADPRAVPSIGRVFAAAEATQPLAVRLLGQVDSPAASRALASMAIFSGSAEARRAAAETLRGRDAREYADLLISLIREPIKYEVRPVGGPGSPGVLHVEGKRANLRRVYAPPAPSVAALPGDRIEADEFGLPVIHRDLGTRTFTTGRIPASQLLDTLPRDQGVNPDFLAKLKDHPALGPVGPALARVGARQPAGTTNPLADEIARVARDERKPPDQFGFVLRGTQRVEQQVPIGRMMVEAQKSARAAQQQLASDVAALDAHNDAARRRNESVTGILAVAAGKDLGQDARAWKAWWVDQLGYTYNATTEAPRPTLFQEVPLAYQPEPVPIGLVSSVTILGFHRMSCFGAGTPVQTVAGPRPIESLKVGDRVLTQDVATGALGYRPVLVTHHNPPSPTYAIRLAGDSIVSSHFHRFWVAGRGWVMARDLKAGDPVRTLGGVAPVESVEPAPVQPVFNLDVAGDADFFAGSASALVHDNTLPDPRLVPFDAAPAAVAAQGHSKVSGRATRPPTPTLPHEGGGL